MPISEKRDISNTPFPKLLNYTEDFSKHYTLDCIQNDNMKTCLGNLKWLAKIKLKYVWKVTAITNIKIFKGKLPSCLIDEIIKANF